MDELASFCEELHSPDKDEWMTAMQEEMSSIDKNNVWELVDLLLGRKTIGKKKGSKGQTQGRWFN